MSNTQPTINPALQRRLIEAIAATVIDHADELTALDQAIGDGDHGLNMKRGFEAVMGDIDGLAAKPLPEALRSIGTPREIYENPVDSYVAARLGAPGINLVSHTLFPAIRAPAAARTIGVRTEHVHIRKAVNGNAAGTVTWIEHLGDQNHLHVGLSDGELVTLGDPDAGLTVGDRVSIELTNPLFFDENGKRVIR